MDEIEQRRCPKRACKRDDVSGKRKHEEDESRPSEILPIEQAYDLAAEDRLSRLPNLCLIKVFKHLPRSDLYKMSLMNKRIRTITKDKSLDKIKWAGGKLVIYQTRRGYGFRFIVKRKGRPFNTPASYLYETWKLKIAYRETRKFGSYHEESPYRVRHHCPIPDQFFTALSLLVRRHEVRYIKIDQVPFDTSCLIERLQAVLEGHMIDQMLIKCDRFWDPFTDDARKSYAKLIKGARKVTLKQGHKSHMIITSDTIHDIIESRMQEYHETGTYEYAFDHRFLADESMIPRLLRFNSLSADAMTLNANWVADLCMTYMEARNPQAIDIQGFWMFNTDQRVTSAILKSRIRTSDYDYMEFSGVTAHVIASKDGDKNVAVRLESHTVNGVPFHEVTLHFTIKGRSEGLEGGEEQEQEDVEDEEDELEKRMQSRRATREEEDEFWQSF